MPRKTADVQASATPSYEEAFSRLEKIVESLEGGDVPLAEMVAKFEEGHRLLKICQGHLHSAELKIEKLKLDDHGKETFEPFEDDNGKESES